MTARATRTPTGTGRHLTDTHAKHKGRTMPTEQTRTLYTIEELKDHNPDAYEEVIERQRTQRDYTPWADETIESLRALLESCGLELGHYELGEYCPGAHANVEGWDYDVDPDTIEGPRAMAWLENNLLAKHRIPWTGAERWKLAKHNASYPHCSPYRAGLVKPCPFTGYCADEVYIQHLRDSVAKGETLAEAFGGLAHVACEMMQDDGEQADSEECIVDNLHGCLFTEDGEEA